MSNRDSSAEEDEDMPGLESVSSSEYVEDSEEEEEDDDEEEEEVEPVLPRWVDPKSPTYSTAREWLQQDGMDVLRQIEVISIHMLSPFLYGCSHQTDKWLGWCFKVGLIQSDVNYNTGSLNEVELSAVDVLDKAMEWCRECVKEGKSPDVLALLLELADDVKPVTQLPQAIRLAKRRGVFMAMLKSTTSDLPFFHVDNFKHHFVETACLYVISQAAEHIVNVIKEDIKIVKDFDQSCSTNEVKYDGRKKKGDDLYKQGKYDDAIEEYSTTIVCCPYNYKLYVNRALCYLNSKDPRSALADGLRAVYLRPDLPKGHVRYIQALNSCGEAERAERAYKRYAQLFPSQKDHNLLKKTVEKLASPVQQRRDNQATDEDRALYKKILKLCKNGSDAFLGEQNLTKITSWYEDAIQCVQSSTTWQRCLEGDECERFKVTLHYAYGAALIRRGGQVSLEKAVRSFKHIIKDYPTVRFPAVHYGCGRAYSAMCRHSEAIAVLKLGLELLPSSSSSSFLWPGTDQVIEEGKPEIIEECLQSLLQQCVPMSQPDATCRYHSCLAHNTSTSIWLSHQDYRGHTRMECDEGCHISQHSACWRKFKAESEQNIDKDFLGSACPTPDCSGRIKAIAIHDSKGQLKSESSSELMLKRSSTARAKLPPPTLPSSSSSGKKSDKQKKKKDKETQSPGSEEAKMAGKEVKEAVEEKKEEESLSNAKDEVEDVRRAEDSLAIIDRQKEAEEVLDGGKQKSKKKKTKKNSGTVVSSTETSKHWNELFTLPERDGLVRETSGERWRPDPTAPFQTPSHLKEAIQQFERAGGTGQATPTSSLSEDALESGQGRHSEELEFIFSFFSEIFKTHGPLKPTNPILSESLSLLPPEKKAAIDKAGGLHPFLLQSQTFRSHEGLICLSEDVSVVAASINGTASSSTSSASPSLLASAAVSDSVSREVPPQHRSGEDPGNYEGSSSPTDSPMDSPHITKKGREKGSKSKKSKNKQTKVQAQAVAVSVGASRADKVVSSNRDTPLLREEVAPPPTRVAPEVAVQRAVQTVMCVQVDKWVMTDPVPAVESFKDRYELVMKEKIDLRAKLEECEDRRFKLQRDHKQEVEKLNRNIRQEAWGEAELRIRELEGKVVEEKERSQQERREQGDQARSLKAEIKSLSEKVERLRKEITRRDHQLDNVHLQHQTETERMMTERRKLDEKMRLTHETTHSAMQRAITAEVDLVKLRSETVLRPGEARLMEIDRIRSHFPPTSDLSREWLSYQEKLRAALENYQKAVSEQLQQVRSGRELSSTDNVPTPSVPLPAHLAFRGLPMIRPPFIPQPIRMPPRGPVPLGARPMEPGLVFPGPGPIASSGPAILPPLSIAMATHDPPITTEVEGQAEPLPGPGPAILPGPRAMGPHPHLHPSPAVGEGEGRGGRTSFDRIVEKLVPHYPNYSREDFKLILREVRRNHKNTLSGLSLDNIADQVRDIIEAKEYAKDVAEGKRPRRRVTLPPVAQAPPPVHSSSEYNDEWSCVICYEDMDQSDSSRLICGHRFHTECIKSWFKEQNTCPTCRNYALLPDDYPFLGN